MSLAHLGLGTYRIGNNLTSILASALREGVQFVDTAPNYQSGTAQEYIGKYLSQSDDSNGQDTYSDVEISTKVGFIPSEETLEYILKKGIVKESHVVNRHTIHPEYIKYQINQNIDELRTSKLKYLLLHNPEIQLKNTHISDFEALIYSCFEEMEKAREKGLINSYGVSSWDGFSNNEKDAPLNVHKLVQIAHDVGGNSNGFKIIQTPISLVRLEACSEILLSRKGPLQEATENDIIVFSSSPLHGGKLPKSLSPQFIELLGSEVTAAQACLRFTASIPGVDVVLTSPSTISQLREGIETRKLSPLSHDKLRGIINLVK